MTEPPNPDRARFLRAKELLIGAGLLCVYVLAGRFGLSLAFVHPSASPVWPPTGIALAALLLLGYRFWPVILLGAFIVNVMTGTGAAVSGTIALGNTLEAVIGAWLVNRFANGCDAFSNSRNVFVFAVFAGLAATFVSATTGVTALAVGGSAPWSEYPHVWLTWWLGDAAGALLVAPVLILWSRDRRSAWTGRHGTELLLLLGTNVAVALFVFGGLGTFGTIQYPPSFLCLLPLMWAAFRFGPRETSTATLIVAAIAIRGTVEGMGPFTQGTPNDALLLLQTFMAIVATFALASAAAVAERRLVHEERAERLRLEELARFKAEDVNRARDQFLATISHELRTPLNDMLSWIVLARSDAVDPDLIRRALEIFERNIRHQIRLIEDLLDVSHMSAGKFQIEPRSLELRPVIDAALDAVRPSAEAKRLRLVRNLAEAWVQGDPDRLRQIAWNLLSNAVKFSPDGGEVEVTLQVEGNEAVMRVIDSGPGIDPAFLPHLFEPFRHAESAITRRHGGLGLGLSIVRYLVEAHGGLVSAEPGGAGRGAKMVVRLPLSIQAPSRDPASN